MQLYGQLNPGKPVPGFASILSSLVKNDGISSIYKGVDAAIGRQLVYGTARIGLHRAISDKLVESNGGKPISFGMKTLSGMASGSIAVCIGTPFDIALVRLQSDSMAPLSERKNYKNVFDALTRTASEEGAVALYKGLAPNVLRGMAMNVGMLACYDQAKEIVAKLLGDPMEKGPALTTQIGASCVAVSFFQLFCLFRFLGKRPLYWWLMLLSICYLSHPWKYIQGFTAALFSMPFDLIKSRLMAQKPDPTTGKLPYAGVVDCTIQIFKKEGPVGFFSGFSAYYGRCAPHAMIILLSIESITKGYRSIMGLN